MRLAHPGQLRSLYHEDALGDHGVFSSGSADSFISKLAAVRPYIQSMQQNVTTANFAVRGNIAEGEIYTVANHTFGADNHNVDVIVAGRYLDKYEKRSENWKFAHRKIVTDWARVNDTSAADLSHPITRDNPSGRPDMKDPSFQFFSLPTGGAQ